MTWPAIRVGAIVGVGVLVIYMIGRWDAGISAREQAHQQNVQVILATGGAYRESLDSLSRLRDSLGRVTGALDVQARATRRALNRLAGVDREEATALVATPLDSLLLPLRLAKIPAPPDTPGLAFATDTAGVRFLAGRLLLLRQHERRVGSLEDLVDTQDSLIVALRATAEANDLRADQAERRAEIVEEALNEAEALRNRGKKWFGFIPKPPDVVILLGGGVLGYLAGR